MKFVLQGSQPVQVLHRRSLCAETQLPLALIPLSALPRDGGDIRGGSLDSLVAAFLEIKCFGEEEPFYVRHFFENALLDLVFHQGFQRSTGTAPSQAIRELFAHHFLFPSRLVFLLLVAIAVG